MNKKLKLQWESVASIVFEAIFIGAANFLYDKFSFINAEVFETFLPLINSTAAIIILLHSLNLASPSKFKESIAKLGNIAVSLIITWSFLQNYPFEFNNLFTDFDIDSIVRVIMAIALVAGGIGFVVEFFKTAWFFDHDSDE